MQTTSTIKHATTGMVYANELEAEADIKNPATDTKQDDIKRDLAISVYKLPDILVGSS